MKKRKKNKSSLLSKLTKFATILFSSALIISLLAQYISPEKFWIFSFFGIAFPYLFIINLFFFVLWVLKRRKIAIYCFVIIGISIFTAKNFIRFFPASFKDETDKTILNIVSYNVRGFNVYDYHKGIDKIVLRDSILNFISESNADIVCLQESYKDVSGKYKTTDTLLSIQKAKHIHEYYPKVRNMHTFGIATLSSFPIISKNTLSFDKSQNNLCIYTDIVANEDTIRIYNAHFASIGLSSEDIVFIETISSLNLDNEKTEDLKYSFLKIVRRLKSAFIERVSQVETVKEHIANCPYPVILCADLNDTPSSYAYKVLRKDLLDAFLISGKGVGKTYNGRFPYFRIDYIFHSKDFSSYSFQTHQKNFSDHFPISTTLVVN